MAQSESMEAREAVASLYSQRLLKYLSGEKLFETNETSVPAAEWIELAERFPIYGETIRELGHAITDAEFMREHQLFPETETYRQLYFLSQVSLREPPHAAYFLADILRYRINCAQRDMKIVVIPQEAHAMLVEYGNPDGLLTARNGEIGTPIHFSAVVRQVLDGQIKLTPQRVRS